MITTKELPNEQIIRSEIAQSHKWTREGYRNTVTKNMSYSPKTKNDWYSTSEKTPLKGAIMFLVDNGPIVEFKCKYGKKHIGVLSGFHWNAELPGFYPAHASPTIKCYESPWKNGEFSTCNYGVSQKDIKGFPIPAAPDLSSFTINK